MLDVVYAKSRPPGVTRGGPHYPGDVTSRTQEWLQFSDLQQMKRNNMQQTLEQLQFMYQLEAINCMVLVILFLHLKDEIFLLHLSPSWTGTYQEKVSEEVGGKNLLQTV